MINFIWYDILYQPLYNALLFFYSISPGKDMGLAIIFLTLFIRIILLPFSIQAARAEYRLEKLAPYLAALKHRYRNDIQKQKEEIKKLLRHNKIGIFSNLFSIAFQLLFLVVLYKIFSSGLQFDQHNVLYNFNLRPGVIDSYFFGWFNLIVPYSPASLFAAGVVFFQQAIKKVRRYHEASTIDKALLFGLPIGTYFATIILPSSKAVFIATTVCFSLWLKLIKWIIARLFLKDDQLKENINQLWTS